MALERNISSLKVVCNAEPFGFGPSSAIARIAAELRPYVKTISYVGMGHTLDLQQKVGYSRIHDISQDSSPATLRRILKEYDMCITAMDFEVARNAQQLGLKTIVYDALSWYWKELPHDIGKLDLYIAQDFVGVMEKVAQYKNMLPRTVIVPPLISQKDREPIDLRSGIMVNFGGISNPFWSATTGSDYVSLITSALPHTTEPIMCVGSSHYAKDVTFSNKNLSYTTLQTNDVLSYLQKSKVICMTPGLGNIYDVALSKTQCLFLPPVNDSQGQQATLLKQYGYIETMIDWHDFLDIPPINYFADQALVLKQIEHAISLAKQQVPAQRKLSLLLRSTLDTLLQKSTHVSPLHRLISDFGSDGVACTVSAIRAFLENSSLDNPHITQCIKPKDAWLLNLHGHTPQTNWSIESTDKKVVGSLTLTDQKGKLVSAHFNKNLRRRTCSNKEIIESLKKAGFTLFAHTTRPENIASLFRTGSVLCGNSLPNVLYGDPLGRHDHILGQLMKWNNTDLATKELVESTGYRTPILLFSIDTVLSQDFHISKGYPFGHYVTFKTSDGKFFPSFSVDSDISIDDLLADPVFHSAHEVVLHRPELSLDLLDAIVLSRDCIDLLNFIPTQLHKKITFVDSLPHSSFLDMYKPYSRNSYDIVMYSLQNFKLNELEIAQLFLREFPELGRMLQEKVLSYKEVRSYIL